MGGDSFFGLFNSETVISVAASVVCAKDENLYEKVKIDSVTKRMKLGWGSTKYLANYAKSGDGQFRNFYNYAKNMFMDELPDTKLETVGLTSESLKAFLSTIITGIEAVPEFYITIDLEDTDWVHYQLQELYNYDYDSNILSIDNKYYLYDSCAYNTTNDNYDVTLSPVLYTEESTYRYTYKNIEEFDTYDIQHIKIVEVTETILLPSYYVVSTTPDTIISDTSEIIPKGTGIVENTVEKISSNQTSTGVSANKVITVPTYLVDDLYLYVRYIKNGKSHLWIYDVMSRTYPDFYNNSYYSNPIDVYPIVMIRNWNRNINDGFINKKDSEIKAIIANGGNEAERAKRYLNTRDFLSKINIKLDDVLKKISENSNLGDVRHIFFGFAISPYKDPKEPAEKYEAVSMALWETFEYLYSFLPNIEPLKKVSLDVTEGDYNIYCKWRALPPTIESKVIGKKGTYKHRIIKVSYAKMKRHKRHAELISETHPSGTFRHGFGYKHIKEWWAVEVYRGKDNTTSYESEFSYDNKVYDIPISDVVEYDAWDDGKITGGYDAASDTYDYSFEPKYPLGDSYIPHFSRNPFQYGLDDWDFDLDGGTLDYDYPNSWDQELVMEKQIDATHVKVHRTYRNRNVYIISAGDGEDGATDMTLPDKEYTIPLLYEVINNLGVIDKTKLIGYVMHFTFFAYHKEELEWYETEQFFGFLHDFLIIVTFVVAFVSIVTFNYEALAEMTALDIFAMIATKVAIAGALYLALQVISSLDIDVAFKMIAAAAATFVAAYAGGAFDDFNGMSITAILEMPASACDMYNKDIAKKMSELQDKQSEFTSAYEQRMETFDKAWKSINAGMSTETAVSLATNSGDSMFMAEQPISLSPSMLYSYGTTAYCNKDLSFTGTYRVVSDFCSNKLRLGVLPDGSSEE